MKKSLTEKVVYKPNDKVQVTVTNTPALDEEGVAVIGYDRKVTIAIKHGYDDEKLTFNTDEDIEKFIEEVDFGDPQQQLV